MANVLMVEGWGLAGTITDDIAAETPPTLSALGWIVSRGSATSGQATLSVDPEGPLRLVSSNTTSGAGFSMFRNLPSAPSTIVAGWAADDSWALTGVVGPGLMFHSAPMLDRSPGTPTYSVILLVQRLADGTLTLIANNGSATAYSPVVAGGFVAGIENWVELVVARATNQVELWVNNSRLLTWTLPYSVSAYDYSAFTAAMTDSTNIPGFGGTIVVGDAYVADERLGRCQVITRRPTADSAVQFTRSQGDSNASQVADPDGSDGDATYVRSAQTGAQDLYGSSDAVPLTNERIHGIAITAVGRKEDTGVRSLTPIIDRIGSVAVGTAIPLLADAYVGGQSVFSVDPSTGNAWALAGAEDHTFGMRLTE